jgi:hypothetical protein
LRRLETFKLGERAGDLNIPNHLQNV